MTTDQQLRNYNNLTAQQDWDDYCNEISSEPGSNPPMGFYRPRVSKIIEVEIDIKELIKEGQQKE